jgi:dTDP-4-amino-4,6-dideoxygalactose transaminase
VKGSQSAQLSGGALASDDRLPLRRPHRTGRELRYLAEAIERGDLSAGGPFTARCAAWLEEHLGASRVLLTPSCTAALDLAAGLVGLKEGDEVVMPSFTSVSTAIAVTRTGATAVFADIDPSTLNLDPSAAADALTPRTRAIVPVHYAGVACDMEVLGSVARDRGLVLIEDAAHAVGATWRGAQLGALGDLGCLSFHDTKNVSCGEGGALILRDADLVDRAEIIQNKGTNRTQFLQGQADHYTWVDQGASYLMSELNAAFLWGQLEGLADLTAQRLDIWHAYHDRLAALEQDGVLRRPVVPADCSHNAHIYHVLLSDRAQRDRVIAALAGAGIETAFHYVPLHSSAAGRRFGRVAGDMTVTEQVGDRLLRLPLWVGMTGADVERVVDGLSAALR